MKARRKLREHRGEPARVRQRARRPRGTDRSPRAKGPSPARLPRARYMSGCVNFWNSLTAKRNDAGVRRAQRGAHRRAPACDRTTSSPRRCRSARRSTPVRRSRAAVARDRTCRSTFPRRTGSSSPTCRCGSRPREKSTTESARDPRGSPAVNAGALYKTDADRPRNLRHPSRENRPTPAGRACSCACRPAICAAPGATRPTRSPAAEDDNRCRVAGRALHGMPARGDHRRRAPAADGRASADVNSCSRAATKSCSKPADTCRSTRCQTTSSRSST